MTGVRVVEIDTPGEEFQNRLWNEMRRSHAVMAVRDRRFLNPGVSFSVPTCAYRFLVAMQEPPG